jgi:two-component system, LuxR family, sensor kinase FixL
MRRSRDTFAPDMPVVRLLARSHLTIASVYLAAYVLLDWASYVYPFASFGITPWNPQTGLSFALILLFGFELLPWLFVAPFLADLLVRQLPLPPVTELLLVLVSGLGYGSATALLLWRRIGFDVTLSARRSLLWLMAAALVSTAAVAFGHVLVLHAFGLISAADFVAAALRAFIGDLIGLMVLTPFLLILFTRRRFQKSIWEMAVLFGLVLAALGAVFGFAESYRFQLFYVFFIPVIWTAIRFGLEGVTAGLVVTQIGLIAAIQLSNPAVIDVISYQALMVVLAITGLAVGVLVSEQQRAQHRLRLQQEALSRASRVGTMGEFAAAVAHEINQPLTAVANYARLAKDAAEERPPDASAAADAAKHAIQQVERAANVVRRLRDFIRLGRTEVSPISVARLVAETHSLCRPELERHGVELEAHIARDLPLVSVDALQIEQSLVNLVRNSVEALAQAGRHDGVVTIEADRESTERVAVRVMDNGPGLDPDLSDQPIVPFSTTKSEGLGLGLSLTRSIIEAHGGKLQIASGPNGVLVSFTLPASASEEKAA